MKSKLINKDLLKAELPPIHHVDVQNEFSRLFSKASANIPWPLIEGNLPIQNPKSVSPRPVTDRTMTTQLPFTKRTHVNLPKIRSPSIRKGSLIYLP
jgi:hypothetical protein